MYFGEKVKKQTERRCFLTCQKRAKSAVFLPVASVETNDINEVISSNTF